MARVSTAPSGAMMAHSLYVLQTVGLHQTNCPTSSLAFGRLPTIPFLRNSNSAYARQGLRVIMTKRLPSIVSAAAAGYLLLTAVAAVSPPSLSVSLSAHPFLLPAFWCLSDCRVISSSTAGELQSIQTHCIHPCKILSFFILEVLRGSSPCLGKSVKTDFLGVFSASWLCSESTHLSRVWLSLQMLPKLIRIWCLRRIFVCKLDLVCPSVIYSFTWDGLFIYLFIFFCVLSPRGNGHFW